MRNQRGFTIVELLVGSTILLILLLITAAYFRTQNQLGREMVKQTGLREASTLSTKVMQRDVMHAGRGLINWNKSGKQSNPSEMSLWLDGYYDGYFRKLYVNYAGFLSPMPGVPFSIFSAKINDSSVFQSLSVFNLPSARPDDVTGVLTVDSATKQVKFIKTSGTPSGAGTDFSLTQSTTNPFTPVIAYTLYDPVSSKDMPPFSSDNKLELRRGDQILLGGAKEPNLRITDFALRALFVSGTGTETWLPGSSSSSFSDQPISQLRTIEVQIKYKTIRPNLDSTKPENWLSLSKVFYITPRNISLEMTTAQAK